MSAATHLPEPADFAPPPTAADLDRWKEADRAARPGRLERLRDRFDGAGVEAYLAVRPEHSRYLSGFVLGDGEDRVAGHSGQLLVGREQVVVFADSRYTIQAASEAPGARIVDVGYDLPGKWAALVSSVGATRVAVEAGFVSHALWRKLEAAAPDVELVAAEGWLEADRATKEPAEVERIAAACAVADRALAALLPRIRAGVTERSLALELEWLMRTGGAEAVAFDPTCLAGPQAALPHGSPGELPVTPGQVLLFDFGAKVAGYRSDMTRTLFVGEPSGRDLAVYELVRRAQAAAIEQVVAIVDGELELPSGRDLDAIARDLIEADGRWPAYGHGLGHGIGLATHEAPSLSRLAPETPLPSPTVFSVEPGIYLEGETGVRIEDLILLDADAGKTERLTMFPRDVLVVGG
ncbi:MAG TPA: Xaa-Pro peptidase family protein [Candidatus Dormibacteraeota bacterium]|nr:Xaa-Pro peptidase family protein [Candidatus Dormibacteraeota bacterium]